MTLQTLPAGHYATLPTGTRIRRMPGDIRGTVWVRDVLVSDEHGERLAQRRPLPGDTEVTDVQAPDRTQGTGGADCDPLLGGS
jgi:hypothetical protein